MGRKGRTGTDLLVVIGITATRFDQTVKVPFCLKYLLGMSSFFLMFPDEFVALGIKHFECTHDLAEVFFRLGVYLLDGFVGVQSEDGDVCICWSGWAEDRDGGDDSDRSL